MKQTIVKMGISRTNNSIVILEVHDAHSGDIILRTEMTLEDYGLLLTGVHGVNGKAKVNESAHIACSREVERVTCGYTGLDKDKQIEEVERHFSEHYEPDGWVLHNNGVGTQQRIRGKHQYAVKRYEPVVEPLNVERNY